MTLMGWISRRHALVWIIVSALAVGGAVMITRLPSGMYPEVEFPRVVVVANGGNSPPDVMQTEVTRPLEAALSTVMGIERIRSSTIRGATELSLQFAPGTDMWRAVQSVEALVGETRTSLPDNIEVVVERLTTTSFPIITFNLTGHLDPRRLQELAEFVLRPSLSRVRGVGRVEVLGGEVREIEVVLRPEQTLALRLSPSSIAEKIKEQTGLKTVGQLDQAHSLATVMTSSEPRNLQDIKALPMVVGPNGSPVPLGSIADVNEGAEDSMMRVSGPGGETVLLSVSRLPGASTPDVVERVLDAANDISKSLPDGVKLTPVYNQADLVNESMRSVRDSILIGIILCVAVIALFLRDWRGGVVAALALPLTLGITFLPIWLLHQSLNLMSLGGLAVAIGLIIDDSIVVVEAIARKMDEKIAAKKAAEEGTRSLFAALVGRTLTTVIVFLPLAWLKGMVGTFFASLAATLSAAVGLSLIIAIAVIPLAAARWMRPGSGTGAAKLGDAYTAIIRPFFRHPMHSVILVILLCSIGLLSASRVPTGFLPTMDEGAFVLDYFLPAGTSLTDTDAVARKLETILRRVPEVESYSRRTGAELGPAAATKVNTGDIMVRLKPKSKRNRSAEDIIEELRDRVEKEVPEARTEFVQVLQDVLNDLAGIPRPIEIKLFGEDYTILRAKSQEIANLIKDVPGLVDLYPGFEGEAPELRFRIDPMAAARIGRTTQDISSDLATALHGEIAGMLRRSDRPIGIRVRYPDSIRFDPQQVLHLPILVNPAGVLPNMSGVVLMSAVASIERVGSPTSLQRENLRPVVIVTADHEKRDVGSIMRDVRNRLSHFKLPEGYRMEIGGQYEGQRETFRDLATVMAFGLIAVLIVLLAQFRRIRVPFIILVSVPLAVVGALLILWVTRTPLNASSLMGCILLVGLVVKNGILLLEQAEIEMEKGVTVEQALIDAGCLRVRPILMTTLATIAGLAPLALGLGAGAEVQRPLAIAVIGGLVVSTAVSLLVMPSLVKLVIREPKTVSGNQK